MTTPTGTTNVNKNDHKFGSGFTPTFGINVNVTGRPAAAPVPGPNPAGASANPGMGLARTNQLALPEPAFYSSADVRTYCEGVRAVGAYAAIEVEVAAEILKAALEQAVGVMGDNRIKHRMRARNVGRKLAKSADAFADAAKLAAAAWAAFQREYADVGAAQPVRPARPFQF